MAICLVVINDKVTGSNSVAIDSSIDLSVHIHGITKLLLDYLRIRLQWSLAIHVPELINPLHPLKITITQN